VCDIDVCVCADPIKNLSQEVPKHLSVRGLIHHRWNDHRLEAYRAQEMSLHPEASDLGVRVFHFFLIG